jgi:DNA processing protein
MKAKSARAQRARKEPNPQEGPARLSESEKLSWLRLIRTPHIGVITFWELLSHFGSASAALEALPEFCEIRQPRYGAQHPECGGCRGGVEKGSRGGHDVTRHA